jgi:hypothetical protein
MNIFNIQKEYLDLLQLLEDSEGEMTPEIEQALTINRQDLETKAIGYSSVIRKLESETSVIKNEIDRLQAIRKAKEAHTEKLKSTLENAMVLYGISKIESPLNVLSLRKSEAIEITDEGAIPKEYIKEKITTAPDKVAIKQAIKSGEEVKGATLVINQNLQIK